MHKQIEFEEMLCQMTARQLCDTRDWLDNLLQGNKIIAMRGVYLSRIDMIKERLFIVRIS